MVLVVRWIDPDHADEFFGQVLQALNFPDWSTTKLPASFDRH